MEAALVTLRDQLQAVQGRLAATRTERDRAMITLQTLQDSVHSYETEINELTAAIALLERRKAGTNDQGR